MNLSIDRFDEFFRAIYRDKQGNQIDPFPWQTRLAKQVFKEGWPDCIDLPTASGKTACIDIAVFVLACQATVETNKRTVGRRIFFTVNRRVIVDEAFDRSFNLANRLLKAENGILKEVADALRDISGNKGAPPLDVVELRGGIYRDRARARSITQPIVVCTTADQLGSRLLFRGYGVSSSMQPVHAALTACDSLILLDEAHVTRAFCQTMQLLERYRKQDTTSPRMRFVQMTATPADAIPEDKRFSLANENWSDPRNQKLKERQEVSKPARLVDLKKKKTIVEDVVKIAEGTDADGALTSGRKAVGIIVNRVQTARNIAAELAKKHGENVHLIIGRMRPLDRDDLQSKLRDLVGPGRPDVFPADAKAVFVVATQCLEVGADYDFDVLITECASIDALRQRFGRLNRRGRPIDIVAAIVTNEDSIKGDDPIYGDAIKHTWEWLWSKRDDKDSVNFGIGAFKSLWEEIQCEHATYLDEKCPKPLLAPAPNAAVLLPAHLDALCQTAPYPEPSPDVSFFIHGPQRDNAEVNVCWRADLGDDTTLWPEIVRLLPPTSPECMTVPITAVRGWMGTVYKSVVDADVPTSLPEESDEKDKRSESSGSLPRRKVIIWRGWKGVDVTDAPGKIRPNDTLVLRTQDFGWEVMGHIPGAPMPTDNKQRDKESPSEHLDRIGKLDRQRESVDAAEKATREAKRRLSVRRHPSIVRNVDVMGELNADALREILPQLAEFQVKEFIDRKFDWSSPFKRRPYPGQSEDSTVEAIVFDMLLEPKGKLELPVSEDDEGIGESTDAAGPVTLVDHTAHVVESLRAVLGAAKFAVDHGTLIRSAELHDIGKADIRFNAMLRACTPSEILERGGLLGKSGQPDLTRSELQQICRRAMYPSGFRHEMLSVELIVEARIPLGDRIDRDLLLHLDAAHHGEARPFASVVIDEPTDDECRSNNLVNFHDRRSITLDASDFWPAIEITGEQRDKWIPSHRLDSGVAERFWKLTRRYGWWGLAWLESILRLADQQASAAEQEEMTNE